MKNTGYSLRSNSVARVAQQRPVVELGHGRVRNYAGRAAAADVGLSHVHGVGRVVEAPAELYVGGVSIHLAGDLGLLLLGHPVDAGLVGFASRSVCEKKFERVRFGRVEVRTHDVKVEGVALAVPFGVVAHAGVVPGCGSRHPLQDQTLIGYYDPRLDVDVEDLTLQRETLIEKLCDGSALNGHLTSANLEKIPTMCTA